MPLYRLYTALDLALYDEVGTTMYDTQTSANIQMWRRKAMEGTLTIEDMKEAIRTLRQNRQAAVQQTADKKSAKRVDSDAMLAELEMS